MHTTPSESRWRRTPGPEADQPGWAPVRPRHMRVSRSLDLSGKRVLDLGCANGLYSLYMADSAREVVGLDHSRELIRAGEDRRQKLGLENVRFVLGDVRDPQVFDLLGHFDLVCVWGFLHRVPDIFSLLYRLAPITSAFALEWTTPIFPLMSRVSAAWHRPYGTELDPTNIGPAPDLNAEEVRETKIQGLAAFWSPTPKALQVILERIGFANHRIVGFGDELHSQRKAIARKMPGMLARRSVAYDRVHMISERQRGTVVMADPRRAAPPEWDEAAQLYMNRRAGKGTL